MSSWPSMFAAAAAATTESPAPQRVAGAADGGSMYFLRTFGSPGNELTPIIWGLSWLAVAVVAIVTALVLIGLARRARPMEDMRSDRGSVARAHDEKALRWIYAGLAATVLTLALFTAWTVGTLAAIRVPAEAPAATIEVVGHQWWWEVVYERQDGTRAFETANEIHVPVGAPVKLILRSADVIHSFWVPSLVGKTDMIPGQVNTTWLRADHPGVFRGQCVEYCGVQHAHMALQVFALPPDEFASWLDRRSAADAAPASAG